MSECCGAMLKYVVFVCNLIFFITGSVIAGIGVYVHTSLKNYYNFLDDKYLSSSVILIIAGSVIVLVAFFGCCGTCTENPCMLYTFGTLLALILVVEIGVAVTFVMYKSEAWKAISGNFVRGLKYYGTEDEEHAGMTNAWNVMQSELECCGVMSYKDWAEAPNLTSGSVPDFCCVKPTEGCGAKGITQPKNIYKDGCLKKLKDFIDGNSVIFGAAFIGIAVVQLISICIVCCLAQRMQEIHKYV